MEKTMNTGRLKTWKDDRGFGFIKTDEEDKDVFIHISSLVGTTRRPRVGDIIHYQTEKDERGKFKAINARIEGVEIRDPSSGSMFKTKADKWGAVALVVVLLLVLGIFAYVSY